jgi:hypothetical protein
MFKFDPSGIVGVNSHFGVILTPCVFVENAINGKEGYDVTPMTPGTNTSTMWMTKDQAVDCTAVIEEPNLRLIPHEERAIHAELAVHRQRIRELNAEVANRHPHYKANGTTDVHAVSFLNPQIELLEKLVTLLEEKLAHID